MDREKLLQHFNTLAAGTLQSSLGIKITGLDGDCVLGEMPVDERTVQPLGYLHGGASAAFAETLGSYGANLHVNFPEDRCLGVELSCSHLRGAACGGRVFGRAEPLRIGRSLQVWRIEISDESGEKVCEARLTTMTLRGRDNNAAR